MNLLSVCLFVFFHFLSPGNAPLFRGASIY
jgi:hypothetical protein